MRRGLAAIDFLWHLRGSIKLQANQRDEAVLDRLQLMLEGQKKTSIERGNHSIIFEGSLYGLWSSWRATVIYDQGQFWIDENLEGKKLRYDLRSFQVFVFCAFAALLFFFFGLLGGLLNGLKFGALAFGLVYGMNILLSLIRVTALIRRTVRGR